MKTRLKFSDLTRHFDAEQRAAVDRMTARLLKEIERGQRAH